MKKVENFYTRSFLFVFLSLFGAGINYLIYPFLSRSFTLSQFGDYVTIIGISNQAMGILLAFSVLSIALVKQYGEEEANEKTKIIQKVLFWTIMVLAVLVVVFSSFLQNLLNIEHAASFIILALIILLAVPANVWTGYLQGHKEQVRVGIFTLTSATIKFIAIAVMSLSFGVVGGLWGFWLSSLIGLFVLYYLPGKKIPKLDSLFTRLTKTERSYLKTNFIYIAQAIFVVSSIVFLQNYDIIRVKAVFNPSIAGIYGGISVLSNALYFIAFLLIWILLPEFSIHNPKNNRRVLRTAYLLIIILTLAVVIGGLLLGNRLLPLVFGHDFVNQNNTLVVALLYQISLVSVALYSFYLLILRRIQSVILTGSVLFSCLVIPIFFSTTPFRMISSLLFSVVAGSLLFIMLSGKEILSKNRSNTKSAH